MLDGIVALGESSTDAANQKRGVKKQTEETPVDEKTKEKALEESNRFLQ